MPSNKRAALISCSDHYSHRLYMIDECLRSLGCDTVYYTGSFDHNTKEPFRCPVPGCVQIPVRPYRKNLSAARILSHRDFARQVFRLLEQDPPQVVVALLPPNFLAHYAAHFRARHPDTRMIFDIFDMWPETFPSGRAKRLLRLPFSLWAGLRDRNLAAADLVTAECRLFGSHLHLPQEQTVYLAGQRAPGQQDTPQLRADGLDLCYLGAINNVVGLEAIATLLRQLTGYKPVTVHVIGDGERRAQLLRSITDAGARAEFYGPVYDEAKKHEIMCHCHFGLNLMQEDVCIGLTMKSVDYFCHSLPILNNVPADTAELVEREGIGVNLGPGAAERIAALSVEENLAMRNHVRRVFDRDFDLPVVRERYTELLRGLV